MGFELHHVSIHGHEVGYRMEGAGPVLLLIHGIAGSSRAWREVMPALADRYTVIAPDLIGHGHSAKPLGDYSLGAYASGMRDLLGALGVERASIVGQWRCSWPTSTPSVASGSSSSTAAVSGGK